jgi:hypothetical protein
MAELATWLREESARKEERRKIELEQQRERQASELARKIANAQELYADGWPVPEIAARFGVKAPTINEWLRAEVLNRKEPDWGAWMSRSTGVASHVPDWRRCGSRLRRKKP